MTQQLHIKEKNRTASIQQEAKVNEMSADVKKIKYKLEIMAQMGL